MLLVIQARQTVAAAVVGTAAAIAINPTVTTDTVDTKPTTTVGNQVPEEQVLSDPNTQQQVLSDPNTQSVAMPRLQIIRITRYSISIKFKKCVAK